MCSFGCGLPAVKEFKNGKWCCSLAPSSCPAQRAKNSAGSKAFVAKFDNPNNRWKNGHPKGRFGKVSPSKGKTAFEIYGDRATEIIQKQKVARSLQAPCKHSDKTKQRLSTVAKERKLGGYVEGSGRGKKGWCRGFFCDSSWELAFVLYHTDHGSDIKRCKTPRTYEFNGSVKRYFPDFVVNDLIYEIKGYRTDQWEAKHRANPDVVPLFEKDLKPVIAYVVDKYGQDYIRMYE